MTKWNDVGRAFTTMEALRRRMGAIFDEFDRSQTYDNATWEWPAVNLYDNVNSMVMMAEVPGIHSNDLDVKIHKNTVAISGTRKAYVPEGYTVHRREREAVEFSRVYTLPCEVDPIKTTAILKNGVLSLNLPKTQTSMPRQINIKTG